MSKPTLRISVSTANENATPDFANYAKFLIGPIIYRRQYYLVEMNIESNIYTTLNEAKNEIQKRWNDQHLKAEVEQFIAGIPASLGKEPRAVLFRNIISPSIELNLFIKAAKEIKLNPLGMEFLSDKFCTQNPDKMHLVKIGVAEGRKYNGDIIYSYRAVADIDRNNNKKFSEIKTYDGESLATFHHRLVEQYIADKIEILDISDWIKANGAVASKYYRNVMALFIYHGILFETYVTNDTEAEFASKVVFPAFEYVSERFGLKPLIVQNLGTQDDRYWWCCPVTIPKRTGKRSNTATIANEGLCTRTS